MKWSRYIIFCISLLVSLEVGSRGVHDFHTSLTEMRLNTSSNSFEITIRVFTDDLESVISKNKKSEKIDLQSSIGDSLISEYFKRHFAFVKKDEVRFANYLGKEIESDATWLYLELNEANKLVDFQMLNSIFMEIFEDQSNLVNILLPNERHTLIFTKKEKLQNPPLFVQ